MKERGLTGDGKVLKGFSIANRSLLRFVVELRQQHSRNIRIQCIA